MRHALYSLGLIAILLAGCENKNEQLGAREEEPYTPPPAATLDSMEAAPVADTGTAPDAPEVETTAGLEPDELMQPGQTESDEVLQPAGGRVYTVQKGDTLYKLARRFYNDQARWRDIWEANKTRVSDPDQLPIGTKLIIP
jgi:nucleoid-associated protein YgaU